VEKPDVIGFIGLGNMGSKMVERLIAVGHRLAVFDQNPVAVQAAVARGAHAAADVGEVGDLASVVLCSLPTPDVSRLVASKLSMRTRVRTIIELSSIGQECAAEIAARLLIDGIDLVDAPVSGGVTAAADGTLTLMVAGKEDSVSAVTPVLETLGKLVIVGTDPGQAQVVKVANNMVFASNLLAVLEVLALGEANGVASETMLAVINRSSGRSFVSQERVDPYVLDRNFNVRFATGLLLKDVKLGTQMADASNAPMFMARAAEQLLKLAVCQGAANDDYAALVRLFEGWSGVQVKRSQEGTKA